jgi:hypothetical protein
MGLTDDPIYRNLIEGDDTKIIVGTLTTEMRGQMESISLFLIDYYALGDDLERIAAQTFDTMQEITLTAKDGVYTLAVGERSTTLMFSAGEQAAHTAPDFWAEYTPEPEEDEAFQRELKRTGLWIFMIITKPSLRQYLIDASGRILHRRTVPLTEELRKMLKVEE